MRKISYFCSLIMEGANNNIENLKRLICEAVGCQATTPSDFYRIVAFVENRTGEAVGLSTVKRLWQYKGLGSTPRQGTLDVLARSLGYRNYADFDTHYAEGGDSSNIVLGKGINVSDLTQGSRIILRWNPGREMEAEYLGNHTFRIVRCEGSKLGVDDTFQASVFALGHSAMLANVIHGETSFPLYEIGQMGGLTMVNLVKE